MVARPPLLVLSFSLISLLSQLSLAQDVREISKRIAKEKDAVDRSIFDQLASVKTPEALEALGKALVILTDDDTLGPAYAAVASYRGGGDLEIQALELLLDRTRRSKDQWSRQEAVRTLVRFGESALDVLITIIRESDDTMCRSLACDPLVPMLVARGDADSLSLVVGNSSFDPVPVDYIGPAGTPHRGRQHREVVIKLVRDMRGDIARGVLDAKLLDPKSSRTWRSLILQIYAERGETGLDKILLGLLTDSEPTVVLSAMETIAARDTEGSDYFDKALRTCLASSDDAVRRQAVITMTELHLSDIVWHEEAIPLAESHDKAMRLGAIQALARIRTKPALEKLWPLLRDQDWTVRVEALDAIGTLRRKESIPMLIDRIAEEKSRVHDKVYAILRWITAKDLGRFANSWRKWWEAEGETFEVPTVEVATAAEKNREKKREEPGTREVSSFYGVPVETQRAVFVLDTSGSMRLEATGYLPSTPASGSREATPTIGISGKTRMDVAKEQLSMVLRGLPDETLFNIIFFETEVHTFSDKLVKMKKDSRQKALRYVFERYAIGATAIYPALEKAFEDPLIDTIYVLTDGAPTHGAITDIAEIRAEVARWNAVRHVVIHGVAMGQPSNLLEWLAQDTGGTYLWIQ